MQKLNGETLDIVNTNIDKLKEIFPDIFSEGKIDFEALKSNLGVFIDKENERYSFSWNGKEKAKKIALTPSTGTLRPCKDESKHWETTENLYIEGDNLEVLKLLQKSYFEKVKMIYIDPPYNTGKDFVYKDNFNDNLKNYLEVTGQVGEEGEKLSTNSDQSGRYHSNWLNMMYPRLKLARNLLKDDGVIFISIDDNEVTNLRKICDEIFGEENFISEIAWRRSDNQANIGNIARVKEYIICYCKNSFYFSFNKMPLTEKAKNEYRYEDKHGKFRRAILLDKTRGRHTYEVITASRNILTGPWMVKEEEFKEMEINEEIYWTSGGQEQPYGKIYLHKSAGQIPNDFWGIDFGTNQRASIEVEELFKKRYFDFPKPVSLIRTFSTIGSNKNDIVLDFFSGSATTAHAVMDLNTKDEGNRKFIMVQLPELTDKKSEAYKSGYKNICEIGKERIRRAGDNIKKEFQEENDKIKIGEEQKEFKTDIGFKVFKLDSSNIKAWDSEYAKNNIGQMLIDSIGNIKEDRTELDLLFELLLKQGLDLTTPIAETKVNDKVIYNIGAGALYVSLSDNITVDVAEKIIEENKIYKSPRVTVIFKDNGFKNDVDKTNVLQTLKVAGISDIKSI